MLSVPAAWRGPHLLRCSVSRQDADWQSSSSTQRVCPLWEATYSTERPTGSQASTYAPDSINTVTHSQWPDSTWQQKESGKVISLNISSLYIAFLSTIFLFWTNRGQFSAELQNICWSILLLIFFRLDILYIPPSVVGWWTRCSPCLLACWSTSPKATESRAKYESCIKCFTGRKLKKNHSGRC